MVRREVVPETSVAGADADSSWVGRMRDVATEVATIRSSGTVRRDMGVKRGPMRVKRRAKVVRHDAAADIATIKSSGAVRRDMGVKRGPPRVKRQVKVARHGGA